MGQIQICNAVKKEPKQKWGYLITRILDTGNGINKDKMNELFVTFKKRAKQGAFLTEGIGIGLSTAKSLCSAMGGNIFVNSVKGSGTSVIFGIQMRNKPQTVKQK